MIVLPKEIAPLFPLVLIVVVAAERVVGTEATVKEFAEALLVSARERPLEIVTAPNRVVPPKTPDKVIAPVPAVRVRACAPATLALIVPPNEMAPLFPLVSIVDVPDKVVGTVPLTVNEFAEMLLSIVRSVAPVAIEIAPSRVVPPIAPDKVIDPVPALNVIAWAPAVAPLTVPPKEILPLAALVLIVKVPVLFNVVALEEPIENEFAWMVVAEAPTEKFPLEIVRFPKRVAPTS